MSPNPIRALLALLALGPVAVAASGCGTTSGDETRGRALFIQNCGTCHTLAEAGTSAQIGPNLDDAFAAARAAGEPDSTIEGIVKGQVEYPRPSNDNPAVSMPADVVSGQDLDDVAAYVGRWAGVPGAAPPKAPGRARSAGLRRQRLRRLPHPGRRRSGRDGRAQPRRIPARPDRGRDRKIDRRPEREHRQGLPRQRDAAELREDDQTRTKSKNLVEYLITSTSKGGGSKYGRAAERRRPRGRGIIRGRRCARRLEHLAAALRPGDRWSRWRRWR